MGVDGQLAHASHIYICTEDVARALALEADMDFREPEVANHPIIKKCEAFEACNNKTFAQPSALGLHSSPSWIFSRWPLSNKQL